MLKDAREKADKTIADIDPKKLPMPIRHGIAPALKAKGTTTFWGTEDNQPGEEDMPEQIRRMMGECDEKEIHALIRDEMQSLPIEITAREYIQYKLDE